MGQANRKTIRKILPADFDKQAFSTAMQKLLAATSAHHGYDCYTFAMLANLALARLGIPSEICAGFAAWRVAEAAHAVVSHHPDGQLLASPNEESFLYHAWLKIGIDYVDFTTYQLRMKAEEMDRMDGQHTPVSWCPDYLWFPSKSGISYVGVRDSFSAGVYHYERNTPIEARLKRAAIVPDQEDIDVLLFIYANELDGSPLHLFGPNHAG